MRRIHGQDEDEGLDLFLTLKEPGYEFGVDTEVEVVHDQLSTSKTMRRFKEKKDLVNWWRITSKHPQIIFSNGGFWMERLRNISGWWEIRYSKVEKNIQE